MIYANPAFFGAANSFNKITSAPAIHSNKPQSIILLNSGCSISTSAHYHISTLARLFPLLSGLEQNFHILILFYYRSTIGYFEFKLKLFK